MKLKFPDGALITFNCPLGKEHRGLENKKSYKVYHRNPHSYTFKESDSSGWSNTFVEKYFTLAYIVNWKQHMEGK